MTDMLIRAWKDQDFRESLDSDALRQLPANPAGDAGSVPEELGSAAGGMNTEYLLTMGCCNGFTAGCPTFTAMVPMCTSTCGVSILFTSEPCGRPGPADS